MTQGTSRSPLTDSQLRATAVPVSGPLTDTELRATPVPTQIIAFSTSALLGSGATYSSGVLSLSGYTQVQTDVLSNVDGTVTISFLEDAAGTVTLRTLTIPYVGGSGYQMFSAPAFTPYVKYEFTADAAGQTSFYFDTKFLTQALSGQVLGLDSFVSPSMVANLGRNILVGRTPGNLYQNVGVNGNGHLETTIRSPINPFGSVSVESLTPIFQTDPVYGINPTEVVATTGLGYDPGVAPPAANSGTNTATGNLFKCSTGTTAYSFATMQSRKRLRYRAGQGVVGRFTALWSAPVASSTVVAGFGSGESGFFFGYNGTAFGILHSTGNVREIQTFTVTAAATVGGAVTFTLADKEYAQTLAASATTTLTANDIASQTYSGWSVEARGDTVIFLANAVGNKTGTFSVTPGTSALTGTYAETLAGSTTTDTWIAQTAWNGDPCDGTGASGFTLDPTLGNVFQIGIAYLGFGPITFEIMQTNSAGNSATWVVVHTINAPNSRATTHMNQPTFPFTMAAYSAGSTTDVSVSVGSFAGFVAGQIKRTGPRMTYFNTTAVSSSTSAYKPIFTIRNDYVYATRANQTVIHLISGAGAVKSTTGLTSFYIIRNATLTGATWAAWSTNSSSYVDQTSTACTFSTNQQVVWTGTVSETGQFILAFEDEITIQPGETITLAVRSVTATATCVGSINTREDQ